jgi:hypothetical protein
MLFAALSAAVATLCVLASARRLAWAVAPTPLDPTLLAAALARDPAGSAARLAALQVATADDPGLAWERALLAAGGEGRAYVRDALLGELVTELEGRSARWARVPRVCASVSTSAGFFFATITVLQGFSIGADSGPVDERATLFRALDAFAIGIAGGAFCGAVHVRARRAIRARLAGADALVARLRGAGAVTDGAPSPHARAKRGSGLPGPGPQARTGPDGEEAHASATSVTEDPGSLEPDASRGVRR